MLASLSEQVQQEAVDRPSTLENITVPGRVLHVDGDYAAYFCAGNDDTPPSIAKQVSLQRLYNLQRLAGAERVVLHLTSETSDKGKRYLIAETKPYQGHRKGSKPKNWALLREFYETYQGPEFKPVVWHDREADDGIAACVWRGLENGYSPALCSKDKDLRMVPGLHVPWDMDEDLVDMTLAKWLVGHRVGEKWYGYYWFLLQVLQGDTADNIPGLPGAVYPGSRGLTGIVKKVGPKTAEALLNPNLARELLQFKVEDLYCGYYGPTDYMHKLAEQVALLWLRTDQTARIQDAGKWWPSLQPTLAALESDVNRKIMEMKKTCLDV